MQTLLQDLRYGTRTLLKTPGFTLVAVVTLALGIGANTALFSVVNAVLLNPFPYRGHARLFFLRQRLPKIGVQEQFRASGPEFTDVQQGQVFERAAAFEPVSRNLTGGREPERVAAAKVSTDFFPMLGIEPQLGRAITAADEGPKGERVLVISHGLWQRRFGGAAKVIGQKVALDDEPFTIVGVMPPRFYFDAGEAWFPFPFDLAQGPRQARAFGVLGRLKSGATVAQANAELERLARNQEQAYLGSNPEYAGRQLYLQPISEFYFGTVQTALYVLLGAVGLILLIACANIASLLLTRATSRAREVAIRAALGASRTRLIRQMLTESAIIALLGGALGLLVALWGNEMLVKLIPEDTLPPSLNLGIDWRLLVFTLSVSLLTALLCGLWPALQISKPQLSESLKEGGQKATVGLRQRRAQGLLVVAEIGLSLLLLVMAGLMIRSFARLTAINPGFESERVLTMRLNLSPARSQGGRQNAAFFEQLIERIKTVPGAEAVAVASHMPFDFTEDWTVTIEGSTTQTQNVDTRTISADFFRVMGIPLQQGEAFSAQDRLDAPGVAIINQTMARRFWPAGDALGKRLKLGRAEGNDPWITVKGVVADSAQGSLDAAIRPEAYFPLAQMAYRYRRMNLAISTNGNPVSLVGSVQQAIWSLSSDQPVYQVRPLNQLINRSTGTRRFAMLMLGLFGALALVLSAVGIYGVMSYAVSQRTHEIGLRMALGAQTRDVFKLIVGQGIKLALIGVAAGLGAAFGLTWLMKSLLYGVSATDPLTFCLIALLLVGVALLACWLPARRAAQVDPMVALKNE